MCRLQDRSKDVAQIDVIHLKCQAPQLEQKKECMRESTVMRVPACAAARERDLSRRTSTGNWLEDRVTWHEEKAYRKAMGYQ